MATVRPFFLLLTGVLIFGCAAVSSVNPVGDRPREVSQNEWGGTWINKSHSITIQVLDEQKGLLQVAWIEEKGGDLKIESYQVAIRESGEWIFGNVKETRDSISYYWALIKKDSGQIIVWTPNPVQFRKLVETGVIRGKLGKYDVILEKLTADDLKRILSGDQGICFEWQNPVVFFRLGQ